MNKSVKEVFHNNMNKLLRIKADTPKQLIFDEEAGRYEISPNRNRGHAKG